MRAYKKESRRLCEKRDWLPTRTSTAVAWTYEGHSGIFANSMRVLCQTMSSINTYTAPVNCSQKYQMQGVSPEQGEKLVEGVTARLPALRPETSMMRKHRARASTLPDLYAKKNSTQRPLDILRRQMKVLREFSFKCGPGKLHMHAGHQNLTKFKTTVGPHED